MTAPTDTSAPGIAARTIAAADAPAPSPALAPPPGNPRFPLFDSLRGIALVAVVVFHVASITGALGRGPTGALALAAGAQAPLLFFVISGFLLYRPYVAARARGRPGPNTWRYARRRVLRVVPAYWVALTAFGVLLGLAGVLTSDWWRYYFFLQLYSERTLSLGIPVAWTLCVEATFYIALPLWAAAIRRVRPAASVRALEHGELVALGLLFASGVAVQIAASRQLVPRVVGDSVAGQSMWFAIGMALAVWSVAVEHGALGGSRAIDLVVRRPGLCWLGAAAALAALAALVPAGGLLGVVARLNAVQPIPGTARQLALSVALLALMVLPAVFGDRAGGVPRRVMALRPLLWLGVVSYGVYLWHLPIALLLALPADPQHFSAHGLGVLNHVGNLATPVLFALTMATSLVFGAASYYLVELPFLRRKER